MVAASDKVAYNAYRKSWRQQRKQVAIDKLGGVCSHCGSTSNLQFDHINPSTKVYTIACILNSAQEIIDSELLKCQLLCKTCHTIKNREDGSRYIGRTPTQHGTITMYTYFKCRCSDCKAAKSNYTKARRVARRGG